MELDRLLEEIPMQRIGLKNRPVTYAGNRALHAACRYGVLRSADFEINDLVGIGNDVLARQIRASARDQVVVDRSAEFDVANFGVHHQRMEMKAMRDQPVIPDQPEQIGRIELIADVGVGFLPKMQLRDTVPVRKSELHQLAGRNDQGPVGGSPFAEVLDERIAVEPNSGEVNGGLAR